MKINQLKIGVILTYLTILLYVSIGIILTPFMLKMLGQSQYGLYQLIGAFVGYMTILDFGFGSAYKRCYPRTKRNYINVNQEMSWMQ